MIKWGPTALVRSQIPRPHVEAGALIHDETFLDHDAKTADQVLKGSQDDMNIVCNGSPPGCGTW